MRKIKFRARRIDNGHWVYGQYFKTPLTDENSGTTPDVGWFFLCGEQRHCIVQDGVSFVIDVETLGQFTGRVDKNGKKIFEGDILTASCYPFQDEGKYNYHGVVEWSDDYSAFFLTKRLVNARKRGISDGISESLMNYEMPLFEVIGNKFEHPNLLEATDHATFT